MANVYINALITACHPVTGKKNLVAICSYTPGDSEGYRKVISIETSYVICKKCYDENVDIVWNNRVNTYVLDNPLNMGPGEIFTEQVPFAINVNYGNRDHLVTTVQNVCFQYESKQDLIDLECIYRLNYKKLYLTVEQRKNEAFLRKYLTNRSWQSITGKSTDETGAFPYLSYFFIPSADDIYWLLPRGEASAYRSIEYHEKVIKGCLYHAR